MSYNVGVIGPRADQPSTLSIGVPGTGLSYRATIDGGSPNQQNPKPPVYHHPPEPRPLYWSDDPLVAHAMKVDKAHTMKEEPSAGFTVAHVINAGIRPAPTVGNRLLEKLLGLLVR
jgi:hypothetical protein